MLDTHAVHHSLTESGLTAEQADAITDAFRQASGPDANAASTADLQTLRADLYRAMLIQAGAIVGAVVAILRMLGG